MLGARVGTFPRKDSYPIPTSGTEESQVWLLLPDGRPWVVATRVGGWDKVKNCGSYERAREAAVQKNEKTNLLLFSTAREKSFSQKQKGPFPPRSWPMGPDGAVVALGFKQITSVWDLWTIVLPVGGRGFPHDTWYQCPNVIGPDRDLSSLRYGIRYQCPNPIGSGRVLSSFCLKRSCPRHRFAL